jgi:FtsP/CotA-like multicopper oxidase with cupredoxin domain
MLLGAGAVTMAGLWRAKFANASPLAFGLSDPALQPKFVEQAPNALHPDFLYAPRGRRIDRYRVVMGQQLQHVGLLNAAGVRTPTKVWGYGPNRRGTAWPGMTFEVKKDEPALVNWVNALRTPAGPLPHLLPVDTSFHWAFSPPSMAGRTIAADGVPVVPHVHGGHTRDIFDGHPEAFFTPFDAVRGPTYVSSSYLYSNDQRAGNLWYHDHTLGMTRLNVCAGLAGFYFVRDHVDTGDANNPLGLPAFPYELAYAIQDRMFRDNAQLFYPAFPGYPAWADFITGEGLADEDVPQPSGLAELFGDHMCVNGVIWPKEDVEPAQYRMRLLNGCDSRFLVVRFRRVPAGATTLDAAGAPIPFTMIGSDQGLAGREALIDTLLIGPGERYDIIVNFAGFGPGDRIVMENIGGDAPFGGAFGDALDPADLFPDRQTDRIMAFDVTKPLGPNAPHFDPRAVRGQYRGNARPVQKVRKVALFEGRDEFGRLQPMLGTAEPVADASGAIVNGANNWHMPTTENPRLNATKIWEIHNATEDAHPVHLHLVNFEVLTRQPYTADLIDQPIMQHNGTMGVGARLENIATAGPARPREAVEYAPKDMVTALPGEITRIKMTFDRPGAYVWHCHILSHEDHDMMRRFHVGPGA